MNTSRRPGGFNGNDQSGLRRTTNVAESRLNPYLAFSVPAMGSCQAVAALERIRQRGSSPTDAATAADLYMEQLRNTASR